MWGRLLTCGGLASAPGAPVQQPARSLPSCPTSDEELPKMKLTSAVLAALVAASVAATLHAQVDRKRVVWGKSVDFGGRRIIKKKKNEKAPVLLSSGRGRNVHRVRKETTAR